MKILLIALAFLSLSACSFRMWDPPNHNQSPGASESYGIGNLQSAPDMTLNRINGARV